MFFINVQRREEKRRENDMKNEKSLVSAKFWIKNKTQTLGARQAHKLKANVQQHAVWGE